MALEIGNKFKLDYTRRSIIFLKRRVKDPKNFFKGQIKVDD